MRLARLLTLVPWLTAHSGTSKQAAAAHFGLTVEALEADLSLISFTGPGSFGGDLVDITFDDETITVFDSQGLDRPLSLSTDEAAALLLALRTMATLPDADIDSIATVMVKLGDGGDAVPEVAIASANTAHGAVIATAIAEHADLEIAYHHPVRDEERLRVVTPLRVFHEDGHDYLLAWCHSADATRTFRLDRIREVATRTREAQPQETAPAPMRTQRVTLWAPLRREYLLEQVRPVAVERTADGIRFGLDVADPAWLAQWLLAAGADITVVAPAEVQAYTDSARQAALQAYGVATPAD